LLATPQRSRFWTGGAHEPDLGELAQRIASDVHQILNGTKRGDIPLYHPNKFQLIINLKTATALGLTVPPALLARAGIE
jgi:putative tryptophan/tyrosine transport system substrate-binding protein